MGNPKQKWTAEEEDALRAGVAKYGTGRWKNIQTDPEFNPHLYSRSNIDLKDKWRNMNPNGQGPREKARTPKAKSVDRSCTEKVQNCYRLQGEVSNGGTKGPIPRPKENHPRLSPINSHLGETLEEAAVAAAYEVAEAENKSFVAAEAVKEAERVSRMAEEAEAFLQLAIEIYERFNIQHPSQKFIWTHKTVRVWIQTLAISALFWEVCSHVCYIGCEYLG